MSHAGLPWLAAALVATAVLHADRSQGRPQPPESAAQATGTGLILGQVVDGVTNQPVPDVLVTLSMTAPPASGGPWQRRVTVDAEGRFFFGGLPPGSFSLLVAKPGYLRGAYGQGRPELMRSSRPIQLKDGERTDQIRVPLWRSATVSGSVVDERGEPVVGVSVRALARSRLVLGSRFGLAGTATTDDRGAYRMTGLAPGDYLVVVPSTQAAFPASVLGPAFQNLGRDPELRAEMAAVSPELSPLGNPANQQVGDVVFLTHSAMPIPPAPGAAGQMSVYPATFHPAAASPSEAIALTIAPGESRSDVNVQLRPVRSARISGRVVAPDGAGAFKAVRLVPVSLGNVVPESGFLAATALSAADGSFTLLGVPAGQYILKITTPIPIAGGNAPAPSTAKPLLWAGEPVSVGEMDISDLVVTLRPALEVSGRAEFRGGKTASLEGYPVSFTPADRGSGLATAEFDRQGRFRARVVPGRYFLVPDTPWFVVAVQYNGRDLWDQAIDLNEDLSGIVVVLSDEASRLSGAVRDEKGAPAREASVLIFPVNRERWSGPGLSPRRLIRSRADDAGAFTLRNLPAGEYFVAALDDAQVGSWPDATFLDQLSKIAARVTIAESEQRTLPLTLSRLR
jgi:hypothetical protein